MVRSIALFLITTLAAVNAFTSVQPTNNVVHHRAQHQHQQQPSAAQTKSTTTTVLYGGASGYATSRAGKADKISRIKELLDSSQMIFTVPASSITVAESQKLRRAMPEGTTISVVKNTIMNRAVEGTEYEVANSMLTGANMWFFIEEDIGASIKAWNAFTKETNKKETHAPLGGVMEGKAYDVNGVNAIGDLPTKDELYAKIAGSIKAVPTKIARVIKAPNSKLARAIKLATMPDE
jgi:large subunit ribosomal protein L10